MNVALMVRDLIRVWWTKDSVLASCLMIELSGYLAPKDVRDMEQYMTALRELDDQQTCVAGIVGCNGGKNCTSDHK